MKQMAHYHPSLPDPCETCRAAEPLADAYLYPSDASEWLVALAGAIVLAMVFGAFLFVLFGAAR
jgi:hypothetical protein